MGLAARATVYTILSFLAFDIALSGGSPTPTSSQGAFSEIARQPAGPVFLGAVAAGVLAYALWRLWQAAAPDGGATTGWERAGRLAIAAVYVGLFAQAVGILSSGGNNSGASANPQPYVAVALGWPVGPVWVALAGCIVIVAGIVLAIWGLAHDDRHEWTIGQSRALWSLSGRAAGAFGNATRGLLVAAAGVYLLAAAVTDDPRHVKSLDALLLVERNRSFGPVLIGVAAAGLLAYGFFSFCEARFRRT
jgi:hypothetical protein